MQIAKLNQRIEVLIPVLSSDGYGGYATKYVKDVALWAEVNASKFTGKKAFDTAAVNNTVTLKTRTYGPLRKGWHVVWQGREYEVVNVERIYKDSVFIEISEYETGV